MSMAMKRFLIKFKDDENHIGRMKKKLVCMDMTIKTSYQSLNVLTVEIPADRVNDIDRLGNIKFFEEVTPYYYPREHHFKDEDLMLIGEEAIIARRIFGMN